MSDRYESRTAIAAKVEWEGGIEGFLNYGFDPEANVPEGDDDLLLAGIEMLTHWREFQSSAEWFEGLLREGVRVEGAERE